MYKNLMVVLAPWIKSLWAYIKRVERTRVIDPIPTPTMAGGLFTVLKKTFYHLGPYDKAGRIFLTDNFQLNTCAF